MTHAIGQRCGIRRDVDARAKRRATHLNVWRAANATACTRVQHAVVDVRAQMVIAREANVRRATALVLCIAPVQISASF